MASHSPSRLIPRSILFGNPERASPQLSPDGTRLAYLAPVNDVLNVWMGPVGADDFEPVTHDTDRGIRVFFWGHDNQRILYLQDAGGDENWRLYDVDLDTRVTRQLTPFDNVQAQVLDHNKHFPHEAIVALNKEKETVHDAYHLDLKSGALTLIARNTGNISSWLTDPRLQVRGATAFTPDGGSELLMRPSAEAEWQSVVRWSQEDSLNSGAIAFTQDGSGLYLQDSRDANAARLVHLDLASGDLTVLEQDPTYDLGDVMLHPDTREVQAVTFVRARAECQVLDPSIAADIDVIRDLNPGDFVVYDRTDADDRWLVGFTQDAGPVAYYAYDRSTRAANLLFYNRPALLDYRLASMEPIALTARDGLTVHGYLTRPVDAPAGALPMVLNVHGGPWHRDTWGYDPESQWLANRGYACLQINFRGSTGYGKQFLNAGDREWGGRMQDDLVDAVRWAVDTGIADSDRVAIFGGSYGGYAALAGITFTPELFCCAVDIVGPSNLITFINTIPPYWSAFRAMLLQRVGNPETDDAFLKQRSPLFAVDRIRAPLLIAQGANDPRVKQAESEQIVAALKAKGIDHEYLLFPDEGHGFAKPENRLRFYVAAERFLARHLGGRFEDAEQAADD